MLEMFEIIGTQRRNNGWLVVTDRQRIEMAMAMPAAKIAKRRRHIVV